MKNSHPAESPVFLYDGICGLCNKLVQVALRVDVHGKFRFAAIQSKYGRAVFARHPELENVDSMILVEPESNGGGERVSMRSEGAIRATRHLGGLWKIFWLGMLIPRPIRDYLYDTVARNRYRLFGKYETCPLPSPEVRSRFLD